MRKYVSEQEYIQLLNGCYNTTQLAEPRAPGESVHPKIENKHECSPKIQKISLISPASTATTLTVFEHTN